MFLSFPKLVPHPETLALAHNHPLAGFCEGLLNCTKPSPLTVCFEREPPCPLDARVGWVLSGENDIRHALAIHLICSGSKVVRWHWGIHEPNQANHENCVWKCRPRRAFGPFLAPDARAQQFGSRRFGRSVLLLRSYESFGFDWCLRCSTGTRYSSVGKGLASHDTITHNP